MCGAESRTAAVSSSSGGPQSPTRLTFDLAPARDSVSGRVAFRRPSCDRSNGRIRDSKVPRPPLSAPPRAKAAVMQMLKLELRRLPEKYTKDVRSEKMARAYAHVYDHYFGAGQSRYTEMMAGS